jgi:hypothetical protein
MQILDHLHLPLFSQRVPIDHITASQRQLPAHGYRGGDHMCAFHSPVLLHLHAGLELRLPDNRGAHPVARRKCLPPRFRSRRRRLRRTLRRGPSFPGSGAGRRSSLPRAAKWDPVRDRPGPNASAVASPSRCGNDEEYLRGSGSALGDPAGCVVAPGVSILCACYCLSRMYVLVKDFLGLRRLPASAFQTVGWAMYIPHL